MTAATTAHKATALRAIVSPSILACDFARLLDECRDVLSGRGGACEWLHVDVMDGHFVPNITIGPCVVAALRRHLPDAFLDVHCMIDAPQRWVAEMAKAGASQMTFHIEAVDEAASNNNDNNNNDNNKSDDDPAAVVARAIHAAGMRCGISLKPRTHVTPRLCRLIDDGLVDMVLIMTVEPGFGGQSFMADMMPKVRELRRRYAQLDIQVDGGLAANTVDVAAAAGANVIVAGTAIFTAPDRAAATRVLRDAVNKHLAASTAAAADE